jgi:hypothetical protein
MSAKSNSSFHDEARPAFKFVTNTMNDWMIIMSANHTQEWIKNEEVIS